MCIKIVLCLCLILPHFPEIRTQDPFTIPIRPNLDTHFLIGLFPNCLIQLATYEFRWKKLNTTSINATIHKTFAEDLVPFDRPIIINKYVTKLLERRPKRPYPISSSLEKGFEFPARLHKHPCVVQLYILLDLDSLPESFEKDLYFAHEDHYSVIFPQWLQNSTQLSRPPTQFKQGVYQFLLSDTPEKILGLWFWHVSFERGFSKRLLVANYFNTLFVKLDPKTRKLHQFFILYKIGKGTPILKRKSTLNLRKLK